MTALRLAPLARLVRSLPALLAAHLLGCATAASSAPAASASPSAASSPAVVRPTSSIDEGCRASLSALVEGRLSAYRGLPACHRADAEGTLGSSGDGPSRFEQLGEYRVYPRPKDPVVGSVLVWFLTDEIRVLQLTYPRLPPAEAAIATSLGEPEAKIPSLLSKDWEQWVYASRGLTVHLEKHTGKVATLFAYRPTTAAAFAETDLARISRSEDPVESLK